MGIHIISLYVSNNIYTLHHYVAFVLIRATNYAKSVKIVIFGMIDGQKLSRSLGGIKPDSLSWTETYSFLHALYTHVI